jgi:type I restriction enzyme R subunit
LIEGGSTILDYTGTATRHFADKEFDGDPEFISEEEIDENGVTTTMTVVDPARNADGENDDEDAIVDPEPPVIEISMRAIYFLICAAGEPEGLPPS